MTLPGQKRAKTRLRRSVRAGSWGATGVFTAVLIFASALPAAAAGNGGVGDVYSPQGLSLPITLLLFVGIPALGFVIGGLLAFGPKPGHRRYRPGRAWTFEPVWFGDESALEQEPTRAALPGAGGAHGSW